MMKLLGKILKTDHVVLVARNILRRESFSRFMSKGSFRRSISELNDDDFMPELPVLEERKRSEEALAKLEELREISFNGGGPRGVERHVKKNKKMLVRDRINHIIDPGSEFVEIGCLAGFDMDYGDVPGGGLVAGIGKVCGTYCFISGNDATVKGGTYFPITLTKSLRTQEIAEKNRLPYIYIPDSGGAYLPLQSEIFLKGGRGFFNQAVMSSKAIYQIAVVCGSCTAGGAYNPTMSDEAIIVEKIGKIYLGGPPLVRAATGEIVSDEELGGAFLHSSVSGCTDYFAKTEVEAFEMCRDVVESLNIRIPESRDSYEEPSVNVLTSIVGRKHFDKTEMYSIIASIVDGSKFKEFKAFFGPGLIVGTAYIQGQMVGIIANSDEILSAEALKASHFMSICNSRNTPLVFLQNSVPVGACSMHPVDSVVLKDRGKMSCTAATVPVPKIALALSGCHADDHMLMCGPGFEPHFNISWPTASFSHVDMDTRDLSKSPSSFSAFDAAFNMIVDTVVPPESTRSLLGELLRIVSQQKMHPEVAYKSPVFRM